MRCPDCNKFVSFDADTDPEIDCDVDEDGHITGSVRIVNQCAECGSELKEANFDVDVNVEDKLHDHWKANGWKGKGAAPEGHRELDLSDDSGSRTERTQTTDRHGKPIKSHRYMKHFYGAEATFMVACECGETFEVQWSDEVQGSGMDELV